MKQEKSAADITKGATAVAAPANAQPEPSEGQGLVAEIMNIMEQGIVVWSSDGICELHNSRIFDVLELASDDIFVGLHRDTFRTRAMARGEMREEDCTRSAALILGRRAYSFDRVLPSGRVIYTNGRPTRGGGYVVTFTDVTDARAGARDLELAKQSAETAQQHAQDILSGERIRQSEAQLLGQLDEWLQSCKSLEELYKVVRAYMERLLPGSKGELYIYSNSRDVLDGTCNWNTTDLHTSISPDSCWALRRGRSYSFNTREICFTCDHVEDHCHGVDVAEYICVPIVAHGDTVGLLHIRFDHLKDTVDQIHHRGEFAIRCGEHISMAIANVKLRDELHAQSIRDPLTGLYNRRYFMDALRCEVSAAKTQKRTFGLVSFDADKFKLFNDNHGHDAGDIVLRTIAARVLEVLADGQVACRLGGEEFAVLVPGGDAEATVTVAEALRTAIAEEKVRYLDTILPQVTISAGIATFPADGQMPQEILRKADEALYLAKNAGRNRVCQAADISESR